MARHRIAFRDGFKYVLEEPYYVYVGIIPARRNTVGNRYVKLTPDGHMSVAAGYAFDGASGPAVDSVNVLRGALVHDACYQLIREGYVDPSWREKADDVLRAICLEDGMSQARAWWIWKAVRLFGPRNGGTTRPTRYAPA